MGTLIGVHLDGTALSSEASTASCHLSQGVNNRPTSFKLSQPVCFYHRATDLTSSLNMDWPAVGGVGGY